MSKSIISVFPSNIRTNVNVFRNQQLQGIVQIPDKIRSFCIIPDTSSETEEWGLLLGSDSGDLYRSTLTDFKAKYEQAQLHFQVSLENQQIFNHLLDPNSSDDESTDGSVAITPDTFVHALSSSHIILSLRTPVLALCQSMRFIFTVINDDGCIKVQTFSSDVSSRFAEPLMIHTLEVPRYTQNPTYKLYILTCDLIKCTNHEGGTSVVDISNELFKSIGGEEASLCSSPILVLTPGEGSVYSSPLKTNVSPSQQSRFTLLYPTSMPVVKVQSSNITIREKNTPDISSPMDQKMLNCLVMCSSNGDSMVLTSSKESGARFVPFTVPCAVVDFEFSESKMFVSSYEDLFVIDVELCERNDNFVVQLGNMTSLKCGGVKKIHCVPNFSSVEGTVSHLLCRTALGRVEVIDAEERLKRPAVNKTPKQGQHIKGLLTAIENCRLQTQELAHKQERQQEFITQLNIAAHLIGEKSLLTCECAAMQQVTGGEFFLSCKVTNHSRLDLSCDWSLLVCVHQSYSNKTSSANERMDRGVRCDESVHVRLNLPSQESRTPYEVTVALCLHFPYDLGSLQTDRSTSMLTIMVHQEIIDVLHFLNVEKYLSQRTLQTTLFLHSAITNLALERPAANAVRAKCNSSLEDKSCEVYMLISAVLLDKPEISAHGQDMGAILKYLTRSCRHSADIVNHEVRLVDPTGEPVKLSMEHWDVGNDSPTLRITITTGQTTLTAAIREAIARRLQKLEMPANIGDTKEDCLLKGVPLPPDLPGVAVSPVTKKDVIEVYRQLRCLTSQ